MGGTISSTYLGAASNGNDSTSHTFLSVPFGVEDPDRRLVVVQGASHAKSSCTIAGNAASLVATGTGGIGLPANIWMLHVPTGTSGTVAVSGTLSRGCGIHIYSLTPASDTALDTSGTSGASINTTGLVIGGAMTGVAGVPTVSWTDLTLDANDQWANFTVVYLVSSARSTQSATPTLSPAVSGTGPPTFVAASFVPF